LKTGGKITKKRGKKKETSVPQVFETSLPHSMWNLKTADDKPTGNIVTPLLYRLPIHDEAEPVGRTV
jgi:hypothetical protein